MTVLLALAALGGQLAAVADALFVAHVTCPTHGDRIHVDDEAPARVAEKWAALGEATADTDGHTHAACLFDDDVEYVPPAATPALAAPASESTRPPIAVAAALPGRRVPLYRLAPKNSPPRWISTTSSTTSATTSPAS
jgi:hypothetical protein